MPKLTLIVEDLPGGEVKHELKITDAGSLEKPESNTMTQNLAISIVQHLQELGFDVACPVVETTVVIH